MISIFDGRREREMELDRSKILVAIQPMSRNARIGEEVRVGSAPLTPQFAICRRRFTRAAVSSELRVSEL